MTVFQNFLANLYPLIRLSEMDNQPKADDDLEFLKAQVAAAAAALAKAEANAVKAAEKRKAAKKRKPIRQRS